MLRFIDRLTGAAATLAAVCLALLPALILAEVAAVTFTGTSLRVSWEYGAFLMAAAFTLGLGWTLNSGGHIRVQILHEALPARVRHLLDLASTLVGFAVSVFLTVALFKLAWSSFVDGSTTFTATATPLAIPQGIVTLGVALLALQLAARAIRLVQCEAPDTAEPPADDLH